MIIELNGVKYLTVEIPITSRNAERIKVALKKYECIHQGIKEINAGGFFRNPFVITVVLVPEKNIIDFNNEDL